VIEKSRGSETSGSVKQTSRNKDEIETKSGARAKKRSTLSGMTEKSGGGEASGSKTSKRSAASGDKVETESGARANKRRRNK
jgi:hypothetical protein